MDGDLVRGLRSRGIEVITAAEAGMIRQNDEANLSLATDQGRALYSFNLMTSPVMIGNFRWTAGRNRTSRSSERMLSLSNNSSLPSSTNVRSANAGPRETAA
jgi:hypothetical protein